jgi:ribulose-bisphosphate carboxylase large chain
LRLVLPRLKAFYRIRCDARAIEARAQALAIEQSVEMPVAAIDDPFVRAEIIGQVETIEEKQPCLFDVCVAFSQETIGHDAAQLLNMLFGNSSLQEDVTLQDVDFPVQLIEVFGGPRHGLHELRKRVAASRRALTCTALKPQGLPPEKLGELAHRFALGGVDYIKDDHGLADQAYSPFERRAEAVARALSGIVRGGGRVQYVPSLSGDLDDMHRQIAFADGLGISAVVVAPMLMGWSNFQRLVRDSPRIAFFAHPSMTGAARIAPPLLLGKLFRLIGADATVFPHYGGRFGYSPDTCHALAREALAARKGLRPCAPVPAGGMTTARVPEMLAFYGADVMLLIGGALLEVRTHLTEATAAFVAEVHRYPYNGHGEHD